MSTRPKGSRPSAAPASPRMQVLRRIDARTEIFPFASLDYETGGRLATEHLLGLGARAHRLRRRAREAGRSPRSAWPATARRWPRPGWRPSPSTAARRAPSAATWRSTCRRHPEIEGAICFSDLVALGMLAGFAQAGVRVGTRLPPRRLRRHRGMRADLAAAHLRPLRRRPLRPRVGRGHARLDRGRRAPPRHPPRAGRADPAPVQHRFLTWPSPIRAASCARSSTPPSPPPIRCNAFPPPYRRSPRDGWW